MRKLRYKGQKKKKRCRFPIRSRRRDGNTNATVRTGSDRALRLTAGVDFITNELTLARGGPIMKINSVIFSSDELIPLSLVPSFPPAETPSVSVRVGAPVPRRPARKIRVSGFRRLTSRPRVRTRVDFKTSALCRDNTSSVKTRLFCLWLNQFSPARTQRANQYHYGAIKAGQVHFG